ncbi:MAG: YolD-like family protein [Bacillota bacterium]
MKKSHHLTVKGEVLDRGQLKWGSLMLPEHVRMLREWEAADPSKQRPQLDEDELELLQEEIGIAHQRQCMAEIRYWDNELKAITGIVTAIDLFRQTLEMTSNSSAVRICFTKLVGIRMID